MRRQYTDLGALIEDCLEKYGTRLGYSGAAPARLRGKGFLIEFGAAKLPGDEEHWKGQPHDFLGIDEASQWNEEQIRFLMGWVRSTKPGQRCRTILATNPPHRPTEGQYLKVMFGPWLDPNHKLYPAKPGQLLWYIRSADGSEDIWVDGPDPVQVGDRVVTPISRTFIPAALDDNPFLKGHPVPPAAGRRARAAALRDPRRQLDDLLRGRPLAGHPDQLGHGRPAALDAPPA